MSAAPTARILVVDDEAPVMAALCHVLQDHGYEAVGFAAGEAALRALGERKFELLLTDLMMPVMDGIALTAAAARADPDLVSVVMTGQGSITTAVEAMKAGALDYVTKPFKVSELLPVLSRALDVRRLRMENVELQRRLRERTAELEASNRELEAFSYSASHDLRAPLRAIDGFSRMLLEQHADGLDAEGQRLIGVVSASARRMGQLIEDLLALSRAGRAHLKQRRTDMTALVGEVLAEQLASEAERGRVEMRLGTLPDAMGDPALLRQVWTNLLSNALKYSGKRDSALIELAGHREPERVVYRVSDNGVGFDAQDAGRLFEAFHRLHPARDFEGTGVGLALVKRIVERHGGDVWAEGQAGQGATFGFWLPDQRSAP